MNGISDIELLDAYAGHRSEEAFRELVARHVDFIYSAATRQLRNPHLAQEATQSAFIALAGKAGRLPRQTVIAGWLHHAVHFAALKLQRSEARRKRWEEEAAAMNAPGNDDSSFPDQILPHMDGALDELGAMDRDAIILRFLQQKSFHEVAQTLGTSEDAAKKRVSRALDKLRSLLARRGAAVSAAALAAGMSQLPVNAAPAALPSTVSALAVQTVPVQAGALLASTKAKFAVAAGLVIVGGLIVLLWPRRPGNVGNAATNTNNAIAGTAMKIQFATILVDDQNKALNFYTDVLGFVRKTNPPAGTGHLLSVVSPAERDGPELILEPIGFAPARTYQSALYRSGIPITAFVADDVQKEFDRLTKLGVKFSSPPAKAGPMTTAIFGDTCGNRIMLMQPTDATNSGTPAIRIRFNSITVADQEQALAFYTGKLGFMKKSDMPAGGGRWLTVVSPDDPDGAELTLEPMGFASSRTYQQALYAAGLPLTTLLVADVRKHYDVLTARGVIFRTPPTKSGATTMAVFDDTCSNYIQIIQP